MIGTPKVTIIMPSLNVQPYIQQCIESVQHQTLKEIEILCIDAGSDDGTLDILQKCADNDSRIRLLHSAKRSYGYQINLGIDEAASEYIGIVETDDYIAPEMYEELYSAALKAERPDIVKGGHYTIRLAEDGSEYMTQSLKVTEKTGTVFSLSDHYELLLGHPSIWTCIYKKDFLSKRAIRMEEAPGAGWVDAPFLYRTMCEAERICWVNKPLYYYRRTNPNASVHLKDCSVPMSRMNECKDYLEQFFPGNRTMEKNLFFRTMQCADLVRKSPYCTEKDLCKIKQTIKRFRPSVVTRVLLGRHYRQAKKALRRLLSGN